MLKKDSKIKLQIKLAENKKKEQFEKIERLGKNPKMAHWMQERRKTWCDYLCLSLYGIFLWRHMWNESHEVGISIILKAYFCQSQPNNQTITHPLPQW